MNFDKRFQTELSSIEIVKIGFKQNFGYIINLNFSMVFLAIIHLDNLLEVKFGGLPESDFDSRR